MLQTNAEEFDGGLTAKASPWFGHDLDRIPLCQSAARARASFLSGTAHDKRLVGHELTHAIQKAAASRDIALSPEKKLVVPKPGSLKFDGVLLGTNRNKKEVRVKREVGGTQGYDDRLQAIAVARIAKAEPAAVVLGTDKKWHALETTADFETGRVSANDPKASETAAGGKIPFVEVHGLPSLTGIAKSRQKVDELKAKLGRLDGLEKEWTDRPDIQKKIQEERTKTNQDLIKANQTYAAFVLGVPESEIELTRSLTGRKAGKVNIIESPDKGSPGGGHAPMGGGTAFEEGLASAFWIDLPELDNPARAQAVLFHEAQHLKDWDFAQEWIKTYRTETGRLFVKTAQKPFEEWLNAQVKKGRLTKADMELIIMQTADASAYTEARANVRTFLAALQAGAPELATKDLVGYARALKPRSQGGQYGTPAPGSEVQAGLVMELKAAYRQMPKPMQQQYDAAVAAAKKENPSAWISELDFSKGAGR